MHTDRLLHYVRRRGAIRARDLREIGVPRAVLARLVSQGKLVRRGRGVYRAADHEPTRHTDLATVSLRAPKAVICLVSALDFHELTAQVPHAVWIAIGRGKHRPMIEHPPIRIVLASGRALTEGVETHRIEGVEVPITSPAKTVADCFKYRRHVGHDLALDALRDCLRQRKATPAKLIEMARIDRVANNIRPYIEALA